MLAEAKVIAAAEALTGLEPKAWIDFDQAVRPRWRAGPDERVPAALEALFAGCDRDGFVREAAVGRIAGTPLLALRAADWVPQVRARARVECLRVIDESPVRAFVVLAPVAYAIRDRDGGSWLVGVLDSLIRAGSVTALTSPDRNVRRVAHRLAVEAGLLTLPQLLATARTAGDTVVRRVCAEAAIRLGGARELVTSGPAGARADALLLLADVRLAEAALTDKSPVVRATAQVVLRRGGQDPAPLYRRLAPSPTVVAGIGETGAQQDIQPLRTLLRDPAPRVRAQAVRALRRLGDTAPAVLVPLLEDPAPSVVRQVCAALRGQPVDSDHLLALIALDRPPHVRAGGYRLLLAGDVWAWLEAAVVLLDDDQLRARARHDIDIWVAQRAATTYSVPDAVRAQRIVEALERADYHRAEVLRFHIGR
ncbi:HEAT repeat domain-containing protein [Actinokineospora sp. HUAS TT18]|uniref:HEAT repeat domain-containing protein n=1 Tax=Actinokineospora sp. HUAS TT18 TaxID=3447451 RepID=UPI003F525C90